VVKEERGTRMKGKVWRTSSTSSSSASIKCFEGIITINNIKYITVHIFIFIFIERGKGSKKGRDLEEDGLE